MSSSEIQGAADRLGERTGIRVLPRPPSFLLRRDRGDDPPSLRDLVAPHWNQAVDLLDCGRGYEALDLMADNLLDRIDQTEDEYQSAEDKHYALQLVLHAAQAERDRLGDALVGDTIAEAAEDGWYWTVEGNGGYTVGFHLDGSLPSEAVFASIRSLRRAHVGETWDDVVSRVQAGLAKVAERSGPLRRSRQLYRFRHDVIRQVLHEFETLGAVGKLTAEGADSRLIAPPDIGYLSAERLLLILVAQEVVQDEDEDAPRNVILSGRSGADGEVGGVDGRVVRLREEREADFEDLIWSGDARGGRGKAKRLACGRPTMIYWPTGEPELDDDPRWDGDRQTREYFDHALRTLYDEIRAAGVKTVDDVVGIAKERDSWHALG